MLFYNFYFFNDTRKATNLNFKSNPGLHCGHFHMLTEHLNAPSSCMSKKEEKLAKQCIECGINSTSIAHLLNTRNASGLNVNWNPSQFYRMSKKEDVLKGLDVNATSAENLVSSFERRDDVDFLYVTFHPYDGLMLTSGKLMHYCVLLMLVSTI